MLEGLHRLSLERLVRAALRLIGYYDVESLDLCIDSEKRIRSVYEMMWEILQARRNSKSKVEVICIAIKSIAQPSVLRELMSTPVHIELSKLYRQQTPSFWGVVRAVSSVSRNSSSSEVLRAVAAIVREVDTPCYKDIILEQSVERARRKMLKLGLVLGISLPVLFILSALESWGLALASLVGVIVLWALIRRVGSEFRVLDIEAAWRECSLGKEGLREALGPPSLPSPFKLRITD